MKSLFAPEIALMNRLKYPKKFLLVGLMLVLPLDLVMSTSTQKANDDIDFANKEILGLQYNQPLIEFLRQVQDHAALSIAVLSNDDTFKDALTANEAAVDKAVQAVDANDQTLGVQLGVSSKWAELKQQWEDVKARSAAAPAIQDDIDLHSALSAATLSLITTVGNNSNLILDPTIDTYYLMDTLITKLPVATDYLAQIRTYGLLAAEKKTLTPEDKTRLVILSGLVRSTVEGNARGLDYVFSYNPAAKDQLQPVFTANSNNINQFLDFSSKEVSSRAGASAFSPARVTVVPADYHTQATKAIDQSFDFYKQTEPVESVLLQQRIDQLSQTRNTAILFSLVTLLVAVYLFGACYFAVYDEISTLDAASQRMVSRHTTVDFAFDKRAEMGQSATFFHQTAHET